MNWKPNRGARPGSAGIFAGAILKSQRARKDAGAPKKETGTRVPVSINCPGREVAVTCVEARLGRSPAAGASRRVVAEMNSVASPVLNALRRVEDGASDF